MLLASQMTFGWLRGKETDAVAHSRIERELAETMQDLGLVEKPPSFLDKLNNIKDRILKKKTEPELKLVDDGTPNFEGVRMPNGEWVQTGPSFEPQEPRYEPKDDSLTDEQIDQINAMLTEYAEHAEPEIPEPEPEEVVEESPFRGRGLAPSMPMLASYVQPVESAPDKPETTWTPATQEDADQVVEQLKAVGYLTESGEVNPDYIPNEDGVDVIPEAAPPPEDPEPPVIPEALPGANRGVDMSKFIPTGLQADNQFETAKASNTGFGNEYPANPAKGDIYLRTDYLPNRLFKFNGTKWIEVDKGQTDVYAYDEMYIKHLIDEIDTGRYDPDQLSEVERQQIQQYLERNA
jgi:hypothetical protein